MARKELQGRENWQTESGPGGRAGTAEQNLYSVFRKAFQGTDYRISDHPTNLKHLYENVQLSQDTLSQIYNPDEATMRHAQSRGWGVSPDFSITNIHRENTFWRNQTAGWMGRGKRPKCGTWKCS